MIQAERLRASRIDDLAGGRYLGYPTRFVIDRDTVVTVCDTGSGLGAGLETDLSTDNQGHRPLHAGTDCSPNEPANRGVRGGRTTEPDRPAPTSRDRRGAGTTASVGGAAVPTGAVASSFGAAA